ncbi:hypothetical protein SLEP1_g37829 [Rubroshorea leprosula]|uniref:Uncharacterized protein n=1 Tax=Rubroshorea leprosula TaxID=152421 RepID=A0AAV5KWI3_9ROSI|nr:hypothetical protein SLEP1_g37829 [Rubroshorea leprosula]
MKKIGGILSSRKSLCTGLLKILKFLLNLEDLKPSNVGKETLIPLLHIKVGLFFWLLDQGR